MEDGQGLQSRRQLRPAESPPTPVCARRPPHPGYLQLHLVSQPEPDEGLGGSQIFSLNKASMYVVTG